METQFQMNEYPFSEGKIMKCQYTLKTSIPCITAYISDSGTLLTLLSLNIYHYYLSA
jgi:hypothetical protein